VEAELRDGAGNRLATWRIDVSPDPAKLGRESYDRMVEALAGLDPRLLLGHEASTLPIGADCVVIDATVDYLRLKRHAGAAIRSMNLVARRPRTSLVMHRDRVPVHRAKRIDTTTVSAALRDPQVLAWLNDERISGSTSRATLDVPATEETPDNPANRAMSAVLRALQLRTTQVRSALELLESRTRGSEVGDQLAARGPVRRELLDQLDIAFQRLQQRAPFSLIDCPEVSAAGLNAIASDPLYASAYRHAWQALRRGIAGARDDESAMSVPSWQVFERWCFIRVLQLLQARLPTATWSRQFPRSPLDSILFRGSSSERQVDVQLQPRFPAWDQGRRQGFYSLSRERYPDIVVSVEDRRGRRFAVLDAKYRIARPNVLDAMQSAHVYRDSLRWGNLLPEFAVLLLPARCEAGWLHELDFIGTHSVGVVTANPEDASVDLCSLLDRLLADGQRD
jgi:hypothetical protein